ncbi:MAG: hypothetical protein DBX65_02670 [Oscillospiraceae bacterium]|nr:MAG: hypothetical protein DBX65_02670 [Oscillospiraceae bacterium]
MKRLLKHLLPAMLALCMMLSCLTLLVGAAVDDAGRPILSVKLYTPRGTAVDASVTVGELTAGEQSAATAVKKKYSALGAVCLEEASLRYNCHSYAWVERDTELTSCWVDSVGAFIQDGSYVRIAEPEVGCIVVYYQTMSIDLVTIHADGSETSESIIYLRSLSHSGVVTAVPTGSRQLSDITVESKWGRAGLFRHKGDVCPYVMEEDLAERWLSDTQVMRGRDGFSGVEYYRFNADNYRGLLLQDAATQPSVSIRNGLWRDTDGEIRYYVQNEAQFVGLVSDSNGAYYYIDETKKAVRGESRRVDRFRANRLLPVGTWSFGEDGAMTNAPTLLAGDDMLNGLIRLANGTVQYLQNGEPTFAGLVRSDAGDYYFIGPSKRALSNITYTFPTKYTNGLLPAGTYTFDSTGKIAQLPELLAGDDYRNGLIRMPNGKVQYFRNGQPAFAGLLKSNAGDYYFIDPTGQAVRNREYAFSAQYANGLLPAGTYIFDSTGKIAQLPELLGGESLVNGLIRLPDNSVQYLKDGVPTFAGLVRSNVGDYYFIGTSKRAVTGVRYTFAASYTNGLLPAGTYTFDGAGKMTQMPVLLAGTDFMNGLVRLPDGKVQYYVDGKNTFAGLVRSDAGDYYFIGPSKRAVTDTTYTFPDTYSNGLLPAGTYTFDGTGRITQLPELLGGTDFTNGLVRLPDGTVQYFVDGTATAAGLVQSNAGDYYFIDYTLQAVRNRRYAFSRLKANGLLPAGTYTFDGTGRITQLPELLSGQDCLNGLVRMPDGKVQFFENGVAAAAGLVQSDAGDYYFIGNTKRATMNATCNISEEETNGLLPAGTYMTDRMGRVIVNTTGAVETETGAAETEQEAA